MNFLCERETRTIKWDGKMFLCNQVHMLDWRSQTVAVKSKRPKASTTSLQSYRTLGERIRTEKNR